MTDIYRIEIDRSLCSGFGACVEEADDVFRLENGVAVAVPTGTDPRVLEAAAACPMGAIIVTQVVDQAA
jgi:ferredoxin